MRNPFKRKKDLPRSKDQILTDVMASQFAKLIVEDVKDDLPKVIAVIIDAHYKNQNLKLDLAINKADANQGVLNEILKELKEQGDERVEQTKAVGVNNILIEGLSRIIKNRTPYIEKAAREGAKDGAHEAVPGAMEAFVEPKKNHLSRVNRTNGFLSKVPFVRS